MSDSYRCGGGGGRRRAQDLYAVLEHFPESARSVQDAAVRMALKRTVVLLKAYADAQRVGMMPDGTQSDGGSKAYSMLTAAFSPSETPTSGADTDLGSIFRIITGAKLRDLDDEGNLIEQVAESPHAKHAMSAAEVRARATLHRGLASWPVQDAEMGAVAVGGASALGYVLAHLARVRGAQESRFLRNEVGVLREDLREAHRKIDVVVAMLQQVPGVTMPVSPSRLTRQQTLPAHLHRQETLPGVTAA